MLDTQISKVSFLHLILFGLGICVCFILNEKTKHNLYNIYHFTGDDIQNIYGQNSLLEYQWRQNLNKKSFCLYLISIGDTITKLQYQPFEKKIRKKLLAISDSLKIEYHKHASNAKIYIQIASSLIDKKMAHKLKHPDQKLIVKHLKKTNDTTIQVLIIPFASYHERRVDLKFFDTLGLLSKDQIARYEGNLEEVFVEATNPVTGEFKIFKPW